VSGRGAPWRRSTSTLVVDGRGQRPVWALQLQVLRELAQHAGHADILREQILDDGRTARLSQPDGGADLWLPQPGVWWHASTLRLVSDVGHPVRALEVQPWRQPAGRATARALSVTSGILHRRFVDTHSESASRIRGRAFADSRSERPRHPRRRFEDTAWVMGVSGIGRAFSGTCRRTRRLSSTGTSIARSAACRRAIPDTR
jgi:hypothetical protein